RRLLHRMHEVILNARQTTIPILRALYAKDQATVRTWQMKAAVVDAQVTADALYTILCLGKERFEPKEVEALGAVAVSTFLPLEAVNLYYPQSQFFSSPYWGCPRSGFTMKKGTQPVPLKLKLTLKPGPEAGASNSEPIDRELAHGISVGMGKTLSFPIPKGVYGRFVVLAGLHPDPELGVKGRVEFTVLGDGKPLGDGPVIVNGTDPAYVFDVDVREVSEIHLVAKGKGLDAKSNYAIWGEGSLKK
ncbi:MAG: NPCBM/NEW2 domain-containing protein, partial [Verrucomicrobium sp.]